VPYTTLGKNLMLDALRGTNPTTPITHVGLLGADAGKAVTGVTSTDIFTATAHGYAAGDLVVFSALTGGANLVTARPYFVLATNLAANTFSVGLTPGGAVVDLGTDVTAGTVTRLVEISGGSPAYARVAIAFAAAAGALIDDSTNGAVVNVPAAANVDYVSFHSASTAGSVLAISSVTREAFAGQGTYTVTDAKLDLLATA
jgi:hypothetical protein